ncbi:MAG: Uma2 family endonuclease [Aeromicrobium sp.]|uniref:Uma2 family endonuclease n=1 Tax=Aeromicrobium sp. TaxID=1871063 RepID=UPI0039E4DC60
MSVTFPHRAGPWTVDDLPDDGTGRYELLDGELIVPPPPAESRHEMSATELAYMLRRVTGPRRVISPCGVAFRRDSYLVPDVVVVKEGVDAWNIPLLSAEHIELAIEVVSPHSTTHDQVTKRARYAAWGIGHYWIVHTRPELALTALELTPGSGVYAEAGRWSGDDTRVSVDRPFAFSFVLGQLRG